MRRGTPGGGRAGDRPEHPRVPGRLAPAAVLSTLLLIHCTDAPASSGRLGPRGEEAVRAVERAYVAGWEANDPDAVMATLAPDAVLVPDGMEPIRGDSAIRAFWWPADGSETRVTSYGTTVEEAQGAGGIAFLRGTGDLAFDWRATGEDEWRSFASRSAWLSILRRGADGSWRMTHRMWHALDDR